MTHSRKLAGPKPAITVVGVGGGGGNAVANMLAQNMAGVEFLVVNTDAQVLASSTSPRIVQLGLNLTQGLGAGSLPDIGRAAAEESIDEIMGHLDGCDMCFLAAGMGGGTGTGATPVIARAARDAGILTVAVVTEPFAFEGPHRLRQAKQGIQQLIECADTVIVVPNQSLFRLADPKTTLAGAFLIVDAVLSQGVNSIIRLILNEGLINLDFADVRSVMRNMGMAVMGTGEAAGPGRAAAAAKAAIDNPLFGDSTLEEAKGVLVAVSAAHGLTLFEVDEAANEIRDRIDADADIIFGASFDAALGETMRVSIVATGLNRALSASVPGARVA